ncbi:MAG: hypothetical protein ABIT37_23665 [Luteolibacter sp.]
MKRFLLFLSCFWILASHVSNAIIDTNNNGVSDFWETNNNAGNLFTTFDPQADPDGDGWNNAQEATAGTNPFDANPPAGIICPEIIHTAAVMGDLDNDGIEEIITPEAMTITWPTLAGKQYTLLASPDLTAGSWLTLDVTRIGTGTSMGNGIPLTQPDGSTPDKLFWRVKVEDTDSDGDDLTDAEENTLGSNPYAADSDEDGISDQDEFILYHTNPMLPDSDGDGVSDWDEIMVNFTNPLSATDADGDGIPDDFEKHLATQLLEFQPDPLYWGIYYAGIEMGDLDASHDYTGDGISAAGLNSLFAQPALGSGNPQAEYLIQPQYRFNKLINAYYHPPVGTSLGEAYGQYIEGGLSGSGDITQITQLTNLTDLSPAYLAGHIAGVSWLPLASSGFVEWTSNNLSHFSHSVAGFKTTEDTSSTGYNGFNKQGRLRVVASRLNHEPFTQSVLKLTSKRDYRLAGLDLGEAVSAEAVTISIPKGRFLSDWISFEPPVIEGQATVVSLVSVEVNWQAVPGYADLDSHIHPWAPYQTNGLRIFPDFKDPSATSLRNGVDVIVNVTASLAGKTVKVKAFDIDDSTDETFDHLTPNDTSTASVIDDGKAGNDNLPDYLETPKAGQFLESGSWGDDIAEATLDSNGKAKFTLKVGMQPGNNYKVVVTEVDGKTFTPAQVTVSTTDTYLGQEPYQTSKSPSSPMLTVWRKLWVENDSMEAIPFDSSNFKRNDLSHSITNPTILSAALNSTGTSTEIRIPALDDISSFLNLESGRIVLEIPANSGPPIPTAFPVTETAILALPPDNIFVVQISGDHTDLQTGTGFRLYDDDDLGLDSSALPRQDIVNDQMINYFKTAFIEVKDAAAFNTPRYVPLHLNEDVSTNLYGLSSTVVASVRDLTDKNECWVAPLTAAYQGPQENDKDPAIIKDENVSNETLRDGETAKYGNYCHSTVFVESNRETFSGSLRAPSTEVQARKNLRKWTVAVASHEIGHQPSYPDEAVAHGEGGLMSEALSGVSVNSSENAKFYPKSILRFRSVNRW